MTLMTFDKESTQEILENLFDNVAALRRLRGHERACAHEEIRRILLPALERLVEEVASYRVYE